MEKTTTFDARTDADAEYEAAIDDLMGEMRLINQDMEERQHRIEKMQAETGAMLAHLARLKAD